MTDLRLLEPMALGLRDAALQRVQDEHGVRVEDYLAVLAACTGEAAIVAAGVFDIEDNELTPGAAVFGDAINQVLSGDATGLADAPDGTVVAVLRQRLVAGGVGVDDLPSLEQLYRHVAESVGEARWGDVSVTVPPEHRHDVLPLQVAFELRPAVRQAVAAAEAALADASLPAPARWGPHHVAAVALGSALEQVQGAIDGRVALTLALEVTFGMAKVVPMSAAAFEQAADG